MSRPYANGTLDHNVFRGPVIAPFGAKNSGKMIAFATGQRNDLDAGWNSIVARVSMDGGCYWHPLVMVFESSEGEAHGTQAPVWVPDTDDPDKGKLVLVSTSDTPGSNQTAVMEGRAPRREVWVQEARYEGEEVWTPQFSEPRNITDEVVDENTRYTSTGPHHAIRLQHGPNAGRLVVPANLTLTDPANPDSKNWYAAATTFYSDDDGATWHQGMFSRHSTMRLDEMALEEVGDQGWVYYSVRNQSGNAPGTRVQNISKDGGETLAGEWTGTGIQTPVVQGSVLTVEYKEQERTLFNAPINGDRLNQYLWSTTTGVASSYEGDATGPIWRRQYQVSSTPGYGYSDLIQIDTETVGVLYEGHGSDPSVPAIVLERIRLDQIFDWPDFPTPTATPTATVTVTAPPSPQPTVTVTAAPKPQPTVTATETVIVPGTPKPVDVYTTPGYHHVNGRSWFTTCEKYSITTRCTTNIWASQVKVVDGQYAVVNDWVFNNLTYAPSPRSVWGGNPVAETGQWVAGDGRHWRTECDTPTTGRNGCRSWVKASVIETTTSPTGQRAYRVTDKWLLNNIVRFS